MSDLRERFNASPELHEPSPEAVELEADCKRAKEEPTEREKFLAKNPQFSDLQRSEVTGANKTALLNRLRDFRLQNLKAELAKQENDLDDSEKAFVTEVLALRIGRAGSVRKLIDDLHLDAAGDLNQALYDAAEVRRARARHEKLKGRYRSMPGFSVTPESYLTKPA